MMRIEKMDGLIRRRGNKREKGVKGRKYERGTFRKSGDRQKKGKMD